MAKKVVVVIKDKERQYEGLRVSLGLLLEQHEVSMIVLEHEIDMTEAYRDNMNFIDEMSGSRFSNVAANLEEFGFQAVTYEMVGRLLRDSDIVIPF
jgi:hypothetical protein